MSIKIIDAIANENSEDFREDFILVSVGERHPTSEDWAEALTAAETDPGVRAAAEADQTPRGRGYKHLVDFCKGYLEASGFEFAETDEPLEVYLPSY